VLPSGGIYLPWTIDSTMPWQWAAAYSGLAVMLLLLSRTTGFRSHPELVESL